MFGKTKISNKSMVALKLSLVAFSVVALAISLSLVSPVLAAHTSSVTITPDWLKCEDEVTFTVVVTNNGPDKVREVRLLNGSYGGGHVYTNIPPHTNYQCGVAPEGWVLIDQHLYGFPYCQYQSKNETYFLKSGDSETFTFSAKVTDECDHNWAVETYDIHLAWDSHEPPITVDCTPPETTKTFDGPQKIVDSVEWIDGVTKVVLTATDSIGPHDAGIDGTYYYNQLSCGDDPCWSTSVCEEYKYKHPPLGEFTEYIEPFPKDEESCHVLWYYSVDKVGNVEKININCFFVDKTPPEMTKEIGDPNYGACPEDGIDDYEECTGWDCLGDGTKDFFTTGRADDTNWDLWIWEHIGPGDNDNEPRDQDEYAWVNDGDPVPFTVSYDPATGLVTYDVDGTTLTWTYDIGKAFDYLVIMAKGKHVCKTACAECDTELTNVEVNGISVGDIITSGNYKGVIVYLTDGQQANGFTVTGEAKLDWDSACKQQEIPAFHVFAMNTHDLEDCWVRDDTYMKGTPITLTCTDPQPHPSGDEEVCYKVSLDDSDYTEPYCPEKLELIEQEGHEGEWCCLDSSAQIVFHEDTLHDLEWFCRDAVDKKTDTDKEWFRVDSLPPIISKEMIGVDHLGDCPPDPEPSDDECYVKDSEENGVRVTVADDMTYPDCAVNDVNCRYKVTWYNPEPVIVDSGPFTDQVDIIFTEDSNHELYIECWDALGNYVEETEEFLVDSTPPETTKIIGEPFVEDWYPKDCIDGDFVSTIPPECNEAEWINSSTPIEFSVYDEKVDVDKTWYYNEVLYEEDQMACENPEEYCNLLFLNGERGGFPCCPDYDYYCDEYPDECIDGVQDDCDENWDSYGYDSWEDCVEQEAYYKCCGGFCWSLYRDEPIYKEEESCHVLYYFSVDELGNVEDINLNCFFVDNTEPIVDKIIGEPQEGDCPAEEPGDECYISGETPITLYCWDSDPHPVDHVSLWYRYRFAEDCDDLDKAEWTKWIDPNGHVVEKTIYFPEDSCHELEYYCVDGLGNPTQIYSEIDIVDNKPPEIVKTVGDPKIDCLDYKGLLDCYQIDTATKITVDASDPDPHPVNDVWCEWGYWWKGCYYGPYYEDVFPFEIILGESEHEESEHELHINCTDALGNWYEDVELFIVDKTPPRINKWYGCPYYENDAEWISSSTPIYVEVDDEGGEHVSGVKEVLYRTTLVEDEYCWGDWNCEDAEGKGDWLTGSEKFDFTIDGDSCHLIEIKAKDNVDKERIHKQCIFVDNQGPNPVKTIGEPKDIWTPGEDGDPESYFYPEETAHCWDETENEIECWEATTLTPIIMDCEDPSPHPVGVKKICFKVDVDGEDKTKKYCREYGGWYNWWSGYCCRWLGPEDDNENHDNCEFFGYHDRCDEVQEIECYEGRKLFYFLEETEHNLKYYCYDRLWNKGPEDEEKFKIEGNKFEIPLFKKWNLISVPFTLLNDDPEVVFDKIYFDGEQIPYEEIGDYINSVWTYDPEKVICGHEWCVWSPGDAPDDLRILPGWGYWVLVDDKPEEEWCGFRPKCFWHMHNEEPLWMVIGGSLFSPAQTPPSRDLVKGWNLIGYYGTKWEQYDQGDFDFMCGDQYGGWWTMDDKYLYGDKVYCALNSLIDTQEGFPRWSSLWSYINCGNHNTDWLGLNACIDPSPFMAQDRMYAGRGYWLELDVADIYAPATNCIWNTDFECVWTGGFIIT